MLLELPDTCKNGENHLIFVLIHLSLALSYLSRKFIFLHSVKNHYLNSVVKNGINAVF